MREDARRGNARFERRAHVGLVGRQEQVGGERLQVAPGRAAAREDAALDRHAVGLRRAEHAHPRDRIVAREDDDLDALRARIVEGEQLLHQRERDARLGRRVEPLKLQRHVSTVVIGLEMLVLLLEVEQRARGDRDDELTRKRSSHALILRAASGQGANGVRPSLSEGGERSGEGAALQEATAS